MDAKKAVPKDDQGAGKQALPNGLGQGRSKKIFVGGLAPSVDEAAFRRHFERFGSVEDAVVMYDHDNRRPRGFGFVTFCDEQSIDGVFSSGSMQTLHDKPIEIKRAVPRDQMPPVRRSSFLAAQQQQQAAAAAARAAGITHRGTLRHFPDHSLVSQSYPPSSAYAGLQDPNLGLSLNGLQHEGSMASLYESLQREGGGSLPGLLQPQHNVLQPGLSHHQDLLRSMQALSLGSGFQSQLAGLSGRSLPGGMASTMGGLIPAVGSHAQPDTFLSSPPQSSPSTGPTLHQQHHSLDHADHSQPADESPSRTAYGSQMHSPQLRSQPSYDQDRQMPFGHSPISPGSHLISRQRIVSGSSPRITPSLSSAFSSNLSDSSIAKQW